MRRGSLRHRIELYAPESYLFGNEVEQWKLLGRPFAAVRTLEAVESAGGDYQGVELVEFVIPYSRKVESNIYDCVVLFRGREYEVNGMRNLNYADRELKLTAKFTEGAKRLSHGESV